MAIEVWMKDEVWLKESKKARKDERSSAKEIAKELGYSEEEALSDLNEMGLIKSYKKELKRPSSTLSTEDLIRINKTSLVKNKLYRLDYLRARLSQEYITCYDFSILVSSLGWSHEEGHLFEFIIDRIVDLENIRTIGRTFVSTSRDIVLKYSRMFPELISGESACDVSRFHKNKKLATKKILKGSITILNVEFRKRNVIDIIFGVLTGLVLGALLF
jgi:hypothetical protein